MDLKEIPLTQGQVALVLAEHFEELNKYKWCAARDPTAYTFYAIRSQYLSFRKYKRIWMHRVILNAPDDMLVDHVDHCGLHNYPPNIRLVTRFQNQHNKRSYNPCSFKGVSWCAKNKKWRAGICANRSYKTIGYFEFSVDAALAYNEAALRLHGEFACINVIPGSESLVIFNGSLSSAIL
jgi:hypothetical protein